MRTEGLTDQLTERIVAYGNFANAPKHKLVSVFTAETYGSCYLCFPEWCVHGNLLKLPALSASKKQPDTQSPYLGYVPF
jgi:hypothetical protein